MAWGARSPRHYEESPGEGTRAVPCHLVTSAEPLQAEDLYEIEVYDLNNVKLSPYSISSPLGH